MKLRRASFALLLAIMVGLTLPGLRAGRSQGITPRLKRTIGARTSSTPVGTASRSHILTKRSESTRAMRMPTTTGVMPTIVLDNTSEPSKTTTR